MTDVAVIGAGPAGIAAALAAAEAGAAVTLLDEQPRPGGQIWRAAGNADAARIRVLGPDTAAGAKAIRALEAAPVTRLQPATVWRIDPDGTIGWTDGTRARDLRAARVILATGATERPVPIPGWTLPGVMTAGAGQILLKESGLAPEGAVLAGSGPLLLLLAAQMIRAGCPPLALVETRPPAWPAALAHAPGVLRGWRLIGKGLALIAQTRGLARFRGATGLAVEGKTRVEALTFRAGNRAHRLPCSTVLLHMGVIPNVQASLSLRLDHRWSPGQQAFVPVTDGWGLSSNPQVYIAGDGAGIAGAEAASHAGRLAGLHAAHALGRIDRAALDRAAGPAIRALATARAPRAFLEAAFPPAPGLPADDTTICRCEGVSAGAIREAARLGCLGPSQTKAFTRAGMGPCQGRFCMPTVIAILAAETGRDPASLGPPSIRPPLKPVTLGELAGLADHP